MTTKSKTKRGKKTAKKTAKKASNGHGRSRIDPDAKLKLVDNPFRPGSVRHKYAELAGKAGTAANYLKKNGAGNYLSWLVRHGNVKVG